MRKLSQITLLSFFLLCSISVCAFSESPNSGIKMFTAGDACPKCGEGVRQQLETAYSPWGTVDTIVCKYHPNHKDSIMERTVTYYWRCDHCEALYPYTETETRTVHLHNKYYQQKLRNGTL